jgi:HEAT repeat protein
MIDLVCPKCATKLPVAETKIGTRLFVCPQCAHPLETPASEPSAAAAEQPAAAAPVPDQAEDRTVAPDASLAHVQEKLRAIAERRATQTPAESRQATPAISNALVLGGIGVAWLFVAGVVVVGLVIVVGLVCFLWPGKPPSPPVAGPPVTNPGHAEKDVAALIGDVKEGPVEQRKAALKELSKRGPQARLALEVALSLLADTEAADALAGMGPADKDDLPIYGAALRNSSPEVRAFAAKRLGELGQQAKGELVYLRVLAQDDNAQVHEAADKAVLRIEEELLVSLTKGLRDKDANERGRAAKEIADMGEHGRAALPALVEMLTDDNASVRVDVGKAFAAIGPEAVLVLKEAMRDKKLEIRQEAIKLLGEMGTDGIASLIAALATEKNPAMRRLLIDSLKQNGAYAAPALQAVVDKSPPEEKKDIDKWLDDYKRESSKPRPQLTGQAALIQGDLRKWFKAHDTNIDGFLDKEELARAFRGSSAKAYDVAYPNKQFGPSDYAKFPDYSFLMRVDLDNDGKVSQNEFELWAYDYAICLAKELEEHDRIAQAQQRLQEQRISEQLRVQREAEVAQVWNNYNNWRNMQNALNRDLNQLQWLQRWELSHLPKPRR